MQVEETHNGYLLVESLDRSTTESGIHLPETVKRAHKLGKVMCTSLDSKFKKGDMLVYMAYPQGYATGMEDTVIDTSEGKMILVKESQVILRYV